MGYRCSHKLSTDYETKASCNTPRIFYQKQSLPPHLCCNLYIKNFHHTLFYAHNNPVRWVGGFIERANVVIPTSPWGNRGRWKRLQGLGEGHSRSSRRRLRWCEVERFFQAAFTRDSTSGTPLPQILPGQLWHYFPQKPIKLYNALTVLSVAGITEWVKILCLLSTLVPMQWCTLKVFEGSPHGWPDNAAIVQNIPFWKLPSGNQNSPP